MSFNTLRECAISQRCRCASHDDRSSTSGAVGCRRKLYPYNTNSLTSHNVANIRHPETRRSKYENPLGAQYCHSCLKRTRPINARASGIWVSRANADEDGETKTMATTLMEKPRSRRRHEIRVSSPGLVCSTGTWHTRTVQQRHDTELQTGAFRIAFRHVVMSA